MDIRNHRYYRLFLYGAVTVLLSQVSLLYYFCMIPIHLMHRAYPGRLFFRTAVPLTAGIIIWDIMQYARIGFSGTEYLLPAAIGIFYPATLLSGAVLYHIPLRARRLYRLAFAGIVPAAAGTVLVLLLNGTGQGAKLTLDFYREVFTQFAMTAGTGAAEETTAFLFTLAVEIMKATYLPVWFAFSGLGILLSENRGRMRGNEPVIERFQAPEILLWPFIAAWSIALLDIVFGLGSFGDLVWNAALVLLLVYGTNGLSLLLYWSRNKKLRIQPFSLIFLLILLMFVPGINAVLLAAVPLLGLSEHWVRYRTADKEKKDENHIE